MRAKFVNEIKQNIETSGLGAIGIGKSSILRGYDLIKKINKDFSTKHTLEDLLVKYRQKLVDTNKDTGFLNSYISVLESITDSSIENFSLISLTEMGNYRNGVFANMFGSDNSDVKSVFSSDSERMFGDEWSYQIIYNSYFGIGYLEMYPNPTYTREKLPTLFNYFIKYK